MISGLLYVVLPKPPVATPAPAQDPAGALPGQRNAAPESLAV